MLIPRVTKVIHVKLIANNGDPLFSQDVILEPDERVMTAVNLLKKTFKDLGNYIANLELQKTTPHIAHSIQSVITYIIGDIDKVVYNMQLPSRMCEDGSMTPPYNYEAIYNWLSHLIIFKYFDEIQAAATEDFQSNKQNEQKLIRPFYLLDISIQHTLTI